MKKLTNSLIILLTASFIMFSCGDDESPKKQFSAMGESYKLTKGSYILIGEDEDDDGNTIFQHFVYLTSGDIAVDGGVQGNGNLFAFAIVSDEDDIAEGTYEFGNGDEAGEFTEVMIYANINQEEETYERIFGGNVEGTIKVSKSGGKHTFRINFNEYQTAVPAGSTQDGEGSLKGYFSGKLTVVEGDSESLRKASVKNPFINK